MTMEQQSPQQQFDLALALARLEGKLDGALMQQSRHDGEIGRLQTDQTLMRDRLVVLETHISTTWEAKKSAAPWPAVVSAMTAVVLGILLVAQAIYGGP